MCSESGARLCSPAEIKTGSILRDAVPDPCLNSRGDRSFVWTQSKFAFFDYPSHEDCGGGAGRVVCRQMPVCAWM
jgi:hypothetical protein